MTRKIKPVPPVASSGVKPALTKNQVYELRERFTAGETKRDLAVEFCLSYQTVSDAIHGRRTYRAT